MKKTLATITLALAGFAVFAQQDAQFSQNMFNHLDVNPGFAGMNKAICATLLGREQWVNFPGAPKTFLFSGDAYLPNGLGGAGLTVMEDQLGFEKTFEAKLAYSYHIEAGPGVLGVGPEIGLIQKALQGTWVAPDGTNGASDQAIPQGGISKMTYDIGFGAYYATEQGLYFGISTSHIPQEKFKDSQYASFQYEMARHYYVLAGYTYNVSPSFALKPSVFVKSDASSTQLDVNLLAEYNKKAWGGVSYRLNDAIVAMVGMYYDAFGGTFKIGYSYDITTSALKEHSSGSHEVMLGYCFKLNPKAKVESHENVRFL